MPNEARFISEIIVESDPADPCRGTVNAGGTVYFAALGQSGITSHKHEGDGATPAGLWPLRRVFIRADRVATLESGLPVQTITQGDGWSDDPADPDYNRLVQHPPDGTRALSAEHMWRNDGLYDVVVVVGHNDDPPVAGLGSAIFMHIARDGYLPTEGCIALARTDIMALCARLGPDTKLRINLPR